MTRGFTPLSPPQEIALRRIAHGSLTVDDKVVSSLVERALIQRTAAGLRLTPLGQLHYDALPKAPLLARQRSIHAVTGYVEGLIEKAQSRAQGKATSSAADEAALPGSMPARDDDDGAAGEAHAMVYAFFDGVDTVVRARTSITAIRRLMIAHEQRQMRLCNDSLRRIELSQSLLKKSVPVRPAWLIALQ